MNQRTVWRAAPLALDLADQSAQIDGRPIELGPKVFALLKALMEAPQRVVTKEELIEKVWDGRFVSDAVLTTGVKELRRALGDDAKEPVYIATVHGRGYRFLKPVETQADEDPAPMEYTPAADKTYETIPPVAKAKRFAWLPQSAAVIAVLLIVVVGLAAPLLGKGTLGVAAAPKVASVAVLPFEDLSPARDQGYFADGVSEEILNVLMSVDGLTTSSRTSSFAYRNRTDLTAPQIAGLLGVDHILEGSIRADGKLVRIRVRLVEARTGRTSWSRDYERELSVENVFMIESEVAERVVSQLRTSLASGLGAQDARARTASSGTDNLRAYDLYLRARVNLIERGDDEKGIEMVREATELDPNFARAWELLAALLFVSGDDRLVWPEGVTAVDRALQLDPSLSLANAVNGMMHTYSEPVDWETGIASLEKAVTLDPKNTTALLWLGNEMHKLGYLDRSQELLERCLKLDPAYDGCRQHLSWVLHMRGNTEQALVEHNRLLRDGVKPRHTMFVQALLARGEEALVREELARVPRRSLVPESIVSALRSRPKNMEPVLKDLRAWTLEGPWRYLIYPIILELGAYELYAPVPSSNFALWLPETPEFRKSEEFKWFVRTMKIESYWRKHGFPEQCWPNGTDDFSCA
ncbi:MAG: hypothetical protein EON93_03820 [Burkholderiales bacterium]|nr:MAG: hypothetical protein EON93_03820 [Burkholderiales bacterium]